MGSFGSWTRAAAEGAIVFRHEEFGHKSREKSE